jgi:hypothetical protein
MSESKRGRRWRRQRRVLRAVSAALSICALAAAYLFLFPALTRKTHKTLSSRQSAPALQAVKSLPSRPVYPYSVIRGGAYSAAELTDALDSDPVAARHYAGFRRSAVYLTASTFSQPVFLSYRLANAVYWTSQPVRLPKGEALLTDGQNYARARCGNRISPIPQMPVNETEPAQEVMNIPQAPANTIGDLNTWSEDRLANFGTPFFVQTPGQPVPLSAVPSFPTQVETTPTGWVTRFPSGLLSTPTIYGIPRNLFPSGPVSVIQPNPIPGLVWPPPEVPTGLTPLTPPTSPVLPTPPVAVITIPPNIFPPDLWPTPPTVPTIPGLPLIPATSIYPTVPTQSVPEPNFLPPTLLACAAIAVARFLRKS